MADYVIKRLEEAGPLAMAPLAYAVREGEPTDAKLQVGGDPRKLGDVVPRGVPKVFEADGSLDLPATGSGRRLGGADIEAPVELEGIAIDDFTRKCFGNA